MNHSVKCDDDSNTKERQAGQHFVPYAYQPMIQHKKLVAQDAYQPINPTKNLIGKTISPY